MICDGRFEFLVRQLRVPVYRFIAQGSAAARGHAEATGFRTAHTLDVERANVLARTFVALLSEDVAVKLAQLRARDAGLEVQTERERGHKGTSNEQRTISVRPRTHCPLVFVADPSTFWLTMNPMSPFFMSATRA